MNPKNFSAPFVIKYDTEASAALGDQYWRIMLSYRYYLPPSPEFNMHGNEWTDYDRPLSDRWVFLSAGVLTDLGSIPKQLRGAIEYAGRYAQAYAVHDQLCEYLSITVNGRPEKITREYADFVLLWALKDCGMGDAEAKAIYAFVRGYAILRNIKAPSTTAAKRALEAKFNFEGF